jgi:uncharacterized membrane protein YwaF
MIETILMTHVFFGIACMLAAVWVFVDVLNISEANVARIRKVSWAAVAFMWIAFVVAGYWYVTFYKVDKAIILRGPWPSAHNLVMETKEHLVIILLLLASYLPIVASDNLLQSKDARKVMLWTSGMVALLALAMDGEGGIIAMGVKVGLLPK